MCLCKKKIIFAYMKQNGVNSSREVTAEQASRPASKSGQGPCARHTPHYVMCACHITDSAHLLLWKPKSAQAWREVMVGRRRSQ